MSLWLVSYYVTCRGICRKARKGKRPDFRFQYRIRSGIVPPTTSRAEQMRDQPAVTVEKRVSKASFFGGKLCA